MKSLKIIVLSSLIMGGLLMGGCEKEEFKSRDTSGLKPPPPPPPPPPVDTTLTMFDAADAADGWETVGAPIVQTTLPRQGTGYIEGKITSGGDFLQFIKTRVPPLDTKLTKENGQLTFWFKVADVALLKLDGQIQVSSSGQPDSKRYGWPLASLIPTLRNGWNQIKLNLSDAYEAGDGGANLAAMNYFKIFFWTSSQVTGDFVCGIDAIQFKAK